MLLILSHSSLTLIYQVFLYIILFYHHTLNNVSEYNPVYIVHVCVNYRVQVAVRA